MIDIINSTNLIQKTVTDLAASWKESGIEKGDTVLLHSSLSGFLRNYKSNGILISPNDILESFIISAGEKGTLIFPTYNFDFTKGKIFDIIQPGYQLNEVVIRPARVVVSK